MAEKLLDFESPHYLHSLFGDDVELLQELGTHLDLNVTTRDAWVKLEGSEDRVALGESVFADLEEARRKGGPINAHGFRFAVTSALQNDPGDNGSSGVSDLFERRLLAGGTKPPVTPRNQTQLQYVKALASHDVVFGIGPAGTGKTFLAMAYALDQLKNRKFDRIVLTRPAVEAGEALGFLPGALEEKVLPYLRPLYDAMNAMLDRAEASKFAEKNLVEIAPLAYMRGRTLSNACVILDEAQNASREQMLMFLTRLGEGSQCIVTGDPSQIDLRPKRKSGLLEAIRLLEGVEGISFTRFTDADVVRHPVVARIIKAYDDGREGDEG